MKIMPCPLNGLRNISEFACAGEVKDMPEPHRSDNDRWAAHVWMASTPAGVRKEWWCHVPSAYWFIAERNTVTNEILRTYPAKELYRERVTFEPKPDASQ